MYRLGLDIGTNSIGWAAVNLDTDGSPMEIRVMGSRIFSDGRHPKTGTSLAAERRSARSSRRRRDRFLQRRKQVLNYLTKIGLFPENSEEREAMKHIDVLKVRALAPREQISSYQLGRVFYHLNNKRGFKSGRKESAEDKKNKISERIEALENMMRISSARTYGEYLYQRVIEGKSTKATPENNFYPIRALLEREFDIIVEHQRQYLSTISDEQWRKLRGLIFYQRPLKPVEVGRCAIPPHDERRAFKYYPSFERYRLLCNLHNLRYRKKNFKEFGLTRDQIKNAYNEYKHKSTVTLKSLKKYLGIDANLHFTIEDYGKDKVPGCPSAYYFEKHLGEAWNVLLLEVQDEIAKCFFEIEDQELFSDSLDRIVVDDELRARLKSLAVPPCSDQTCSFSAKVLREVVAESVESGEHPQSIILKLINKVTVNANSNGKLEYYGKVIPEAVQPIPEHIKNNVDVDINSDERRFGKIANPTVHIGLNQLCHLFNEIVSIHGLPKEIHIEFARELKLSQAQKDEVKRRQKQNEELNKKVRLFIKEHGKEGMKDSPFNMEKVKLWFEMENCLQRRCVYSGKIISQEMVLSEKVEIDHILPFSRTLDNSFSNKVLVLASVNRAKGNGSPFEAFGRDVEKYETILARAAKLPANKRWRFADNAIERFEAENQWLARQLTDTSYVSKVAKKYLSTVVEANRIVAHPGRLTALVRSKLGLNSVIDENDTNKNQKKERYDHRHHAIDALVVALMDRSLLQRMATANQNSRGKIIIPEPWNNFYDSVKRAVREIRVSHKVDHGKNGAFMDATAYGLLKSRSNYEVENNFKLVTTKPLADVLGDANEVRASNEGKKRSKRKKGADLIVDKNLRELAHKKGLKHLEKIGVKRVRIYSVSREDIDKFGKLESGLAKIVHGTRSQHLKFYEKGDVHHIAFWRRPDGVVSIRCIKTYDYNRLQHHHFRPHPAAKLIMRLCKGDTVALAANGQLGYYLVKTIRPSNQIIGLLSINQVKETTSQKMLWLSFAKAKDVKLRKIRITPAGRVFDNGPVL